MEDEKNRENKSKIEKKDDCGNEKKIANVIYTIRPQTILEHCFGVNRFRLVDGELRPPSRFMKTLGVFTILVVSAIYFYIAEFPASFSDKNQLVYTLDDLPSLVVLTQYVFSVISSAFFFNSINIRICNSLAEIDTILRVETSTNYYRRLRSQITKLLILLIISHIINGVIDWVSELDIVWGLIVFPIYFIQKLEVFVFCSYVLKLRYRLIMMNSYMKAFIQEQDKRIVTIYTIKDTKTKNEEKTFNFIGRPSERNLKIRDLATVYDNIGTTCSMINTAFNPQIFLTLVSTFTYIVITIWTSLYFYKRSNYNWNKMVNIAIWCFGTICNVAYMSFTCERLLVVRNETKILVNKIIMNYNLPKTMRVQAKAFMELLEAWPLRIFVYDMFSIDITLMLKFISVATTYLIVIVQISHFM